MNHNQSPPPTGLLLRLAHQRTARLFAERLRPLGLENVQAGLLIQLGAHGARTQRQLMDAIGLDKSTMVRQLDTLEARGAVRRGPHPTDRRAHAVELTASGEALLAEVRAVAAQTDQEALALLSPERQQALREMLAMVAASCPEDQLH